MIRFVDLGKQLGLDEEWPRQFAFFDTLTDIFLSFNGEQVFSSMQEFKDAFDFDMRDNPSDNRPLSRFTSLCPDWVTHAKTGE
jgi:hypothetical protein